MNELAATAPLTGGHVDVVVVGGGIIGCACAYELARSGVGTVLIESGDLNRAASGTNAGNIHLQAFDPALNPWGEARWLEVARVHSEAARRWQQLEGALGEDLGVRLNGGLMVAETVEQVRTLTRKRGIEHGLGIEAEIVSGKDLLSIFPGCGDAVRAGDWCPQEGFANPLLAGPAFARRAVSYGAQVYTGCRLLEIEGRIGRFTLRTTRGTLGAGRVIDAAGAEAGAVASLAGGRVATSARALTMNVTEPWPPVMRIVVQHIARRLTLKQVLNGTFLIGGGWPGRTGLHGTVEADPKSVAANLWTAQHVMPLIGKVRLLRSWGALIPAMDDRTAIVGELGEVPGLYVAAADITGFSLAPLIGETIAALVTGRSMSVDMSLFHPDASASAMRCA